MKCQNCGFVAAQEVSFCPNCGAKVESAPAPAPDPTPVASATPLNPLADRVLLACKDTLYLVMCVLVSAEALLGIMAADPPIIEIILAVFMWLIYADANKNEVNVSRFRCLSGAVYASYVVNNVLLIIGFVAGIVGMIFTAIQNYFVKDFIRNLIFELIKEFGGEFDLNGLYGFKQEIDVFSGISQSILTIIMVVILFVVFITLIISLAINIFGYRKFHKLAKSVYKGIESGTPIKAKLVKAVYVWLWVYAILEGVSALSAISGNITALLVAGCPTAICILSAVLVKKHLMTNSETIAQ